MTVISHPVKNVFLPVLSVADCFLCSKNASKSMLEKKTKTKRTLTGINFKKTIFRSGSYNELITADAKIK